MAPSAGEIILEFVGQSALRPATPGAGTADDNDGNEDTTRVTSAPGIVTFGRPGGAGAHQDYVSACVPSADPSQASQCHLLIEMANGAIGIPEPLLAYLPSAVLRTSNTSIAQDHLGRSAGPNYVRFRSGIVPASMGTAHSLASAPTRALEQAVGSW